ncbi:MAG: A24 family peptidase [Caldilineaceae bacterium]
MNNPFLTTWLLYGWYGIAIVIFAYCAWVDARTRRIPNQATYPALLISLGVTFLAGQWPDALWGMLLAGLVFFVPRLIGGAKKAGMGDVKLAMIGGLLLGWSDSIYAVLLALFLALLIQLPRLIGKRLRWSDTIPFGPYLALAFSLFLLVKILR